MNNIPDPRLCLFTLEIAWERHFTSFNPSPTTSWKLWAKQDSCCREPRGKFLSNGSPAMSSSSSLSSEWVYCHHNFKSFFHVRCIICDNKFYLITYIVFFQNFIKCSYKVFSTLKSFKSSAVKDEGLQSVLISCGVTNMSCYSQVRPQCAIWQTRLNTLFDSGH